MKMPSLEKLLDELLVVYPTHDCVVKKDGETVARIIGRDESVHKTALTGKEKYNLYSCSKPITCVVALTLYEKGKFSLDDDLAGYLPEFKDMSVRSGCGAFPAKNKIKVRDLFMMTAGFDYNTDSPAIRRFKADTDGKCPTSLFPKYIASEPLSFEPRTSWQYSLCHDVLVCLVEKITGEIFDDYARKVVFDPLGMKNTTYRLVSDEEKSAQYMWNETEKRPLPCGNDIKWYKFGSEYESGGAGAVSTVEDYIEFLEGLRTGRIINPDTLALMSTDMLDDCMRQTYWPNNDGYGYGLGVRVPFVGSSRTDIGWGGAAGSFLALDEKNGVSLFCSLNTLCSPISSRRYEITDCVKKDLGL